MIHYYKRISKYKLRDNDTRTYCGLSVVDVAKHPSHEVDHVVMDRDLGEMCPECSEHPEIQMQILSVTEI